PLSRGFAVTGYGIKVVPVAAVHWVQTPNGIIASRFIKAKSDGRTIATHKAKFVVQEGQLRVELEPPTTSESLLFVDKQDGPADKQWRIETPQFCFVWPPTFAIRFPAASKTMFDLVQPDNSLIYIQGPLAKDHFDINDVAVQGQTVVQQGSEPCPWT